MKKHVTLVLAVIMLAVLIPIFTAPAAAADPVSNDPVTITAGGATINLTDETITLPDGYTVAAYSLDGGRKWKKGSLPSGDKFKKLFNKELELWLTNKWIDRDVKEGGVVVTAKGVAPDAEQIKFDKTKARPKKNEDKLKPYYGDTHWVLAKKDTTAAVFNGYEYAPSSNGKTPNDGVWFKMPAEGIELIPGKAKSTYLVRAAPDSDKPASAPFKVKPANLGKAPNYRVKEAKDPADNTKTIRLLLFKKGDQYSIGDQVSFCPALTDKETRKVAELGPEGTELFVRKAATGKKPPSEPQKIELPAGSGEAAKKVLVTVTGPAGATYKYSQSSFATAVNGTNFPAAGFNLTVGASIYIHAEWTDNGVKKTQQQSYKALPEHVDTGMELTFDTWVADSIIVAAKAQPAVGATSIVITGVDFKTIAVLSDFTITSPAGKNVTILSVNAEKTEVTFTISSALAAKDVITIQAKKSAFSPEPANPSKTVTFTVPAP